MILTTKGLHEVKRTDILKKISEEDIWNHYTGLEIQTKYKFLNPLYDDKVPSAMFFYTNSGRLLLKDFGEDTYNVFSFLMKKFNLKYHQIIRKVYDELILNKNRPDIEYYGQQIKRIRRNKKIIPYFKDFTQEELEYWSQYKFTKDTLEVLRIKSLDHYWIVSEDYSVKISRPFTFAYCFGNKEYKIYSPFETDHKWYSNASNDTLQGEHLLPWLGDLLIITKSLKDVGVLFNLNYNSVGVQGENSFPSKEKMKAYLYRFTNVIILFDNDKAGIEGAIKFSKMYNLKYFFLNEAKDISDFLKYNNEIKTKELICSKLEILLK